MGGRPQVVGLLALAVAVWFASPVAAPPAAAEIRVPLPGFEAKKKGQRKRYVRPTMPSRNPTRATARLSAIAVSPPQAKGSEVSTAAGATSSASVSLALPRKPEQPAEIDSQSSTAAVTGDAAGTDAGVETAETEDSSQAAAEDAEEQTAEAADATDSAAEQVGADTETVAEDAKEAAKEEIASEAGEAADGAAEEAKGTAESAAETVETATDAASDNAEEQVAEDAAASSEMDEAAEQTAESDAEAMENTDDEKTADAAPASTEDDEDVQERASENTAEQKSETAATGSKEEDSAPEPAEFADQSKDAPALAEDAAVGTDAKAATSANDSIETTVLADHDATVVLDVAPPPDSAESAQSENDSAETDVAVLTPPSAPDKRPPDNDAKSSEATESDSAPAETNSEGMTADGDAADETKPSADETQTPDTAAEAEEEEEGEAEEEVAEEPAPPPAHPVVAQIREKLQDPALTKSVAASDLEALKSFYGTHEGAPLWVTDDGLKAKAQDAIAEIGKADDWGLAASSFKLPRADASLTTPNALADAELELSVATLGYARDAQIGRLTPRRVSKLFDQHPALRDPATVLKETAAAGDPSVYLLSLHPQHDQFKQLQKALLNARQSAEATGRDPTTDQNVQLITINMERWRWLPRSLGNYHVWNNVPEFKVRVKKDGRTIYEEKTIVGQLKYATPFFSAKMRNIVFHPNWTVPPTIVKEDIAPKLQGNADGGFFGNSKEATLRRYGLKANYKGEPINADTVDWNNVNVHSYTFVQDPGPANVLGKFKFNFPNKHAIYMHDTVQPELFSQRTRTLSHGCIRVNQPDGFATLLLGQDKGWTAGNVRSLVARNESKVISLNRHVPVHLTYFTAFVDEYGNLNKVGDIYGIDNLMAPKLFRRPAAFPVPPPAVVAESSSSRTQSRRGRRRGSGDFNNFISGLFGN